MSSPHVCLSWTQDLSRAPRTPPAGHVVLALLPDAPTLPMTVSWKRYDADDATEIGAEGYWDFEDSLNSEVTGGIADTELAETLWCLVPLPDPAAA